MFEKLSSTKSHFSLSLSLSLFMMLLPFFICIINRVCSHLTFVIFGFAVLLFSFSFNRHWFNLFFVDIIDSVRTPLEYRSVCMHIYISLFIHSFRFNDWYMCVSYTFIPFLWVILRNFYVEFHTFIYRRNIFTVHLNAVYQQHQQRQQNDLCEL